MTEEERFERYCLEQDMQRHIDEIEEEIEGLCQVTDHYVNENGFSIVGTGPFVTTDRKLFDVVVMGKPENLEMSAYIEIYPEWNEKEDNQYLERAKTALGKSISNINICPVGEGAWRKVL